jgi:hypothetical protein
MYKITRLQDNKTWETKEIHYIHFDSHGRYAHTESTPSVNTALLIGKLSLYYVWMTTQIKEIINTSENSYKLITKNSTYEVTKHI